MERFRILFVLISLINVIKASNCPVSGRKCTSRDTFTYCLNLDDRKTLTLDFFQIKCNKPFICTELLDKPCVNESEIPATPKPETKNTKNTLKNKFHKKLPQARIQVWKTNYFKELTFQETTTTSNGYTNNTTDNVETSTEGVITLETQGVTTNSVTSQETEKNSETSTPTEPSMTCPNPTLGGEPECKKFDQRFRGPTCSTYYRCVPNFFGYKGELLNCENNKAYSLLENNCVTPPNGCSCAF